jgi:hypothetical protein
VYDIRVLFQIDRGPSDAVTMARLFLLPSGVWAAGWMFVSVAMLGATLWTTPRAALTARQSFETLICDVNCDVTFPKHGL